MTQTRKQRRAAKRAQQGVLRGEQPKGNATPKRPPHGLTRAAYTRLQGRKARRELEDAPGVAQRALETLRGARREEQAAIEKLLREAGGVDLSSIREKGQHR